MSCSYLRLNLNTTPPPLQGRLLLLRRDKKKSCFEAPTPFPPSLAHKLTRRARKYCGRNQSQSEAPPPHAHQYFMSGASHKIPKLTPWFVCFLSCRIQFIQSFWLIHCPCTYIKAVNILQGRVFRQGPDAACDAAAEQRDASLQDGPALGLENK